MARQKQSRGNCNFCQKEMTRAGLTKHFKSCKARQAVLESVKRTKSETIYHLVISAPYQPGMWLQLEMGESRMLEELDGYLRSIWLECCGHLSAFRIGGISYEPSRSYKESQGWYDVQSMAVKLGKVVTVGDKFDYEYDFGSTTNLTVMVAGKRKGSAMTKFPIYLMARNQMPLFECQLCGEKAEYLCQECIYEDEEIGLLCEAHAEDHPHEDYGEPMLIVNSPRLGECGYEGPAEPPY